MATCGGALRLLRGNPPFRALLAARVVSFTGDSLSLVALMLYVADTTGQALAVSLLLLVGDFLPALLSPVTGAISDRFSRTRVMIVCELVQGGVMALIAVALPMPLPMLLALVAVRAIAGQVFLPASRAAVPALVRTDDLETANSTLGFGTNGAEAVGPLIAAALFPLAGVRGVLPADAATFLVSAALLIGLRRPASTPAESRQKPSLLADARSGLGYIWAAPAVRVIALGFFAVVACNGSTTSPWCCWPPRPSARATRRSDCCSPRSASGCWPAICCWPGTAPACRWWRCCPSASRSAASATSSPGWPGRSPRRSRCRPYADSASRRWTSPPTRCCSAWSRPGCWAGSSATCTARSAWPRDCRTSAAASCWTPPPPRRRSSSPEPPARWPPSAVARSLPRAHAGRRAP